MAVTRVFWVRHGPTHQRSFTGWRDVPADLSDVAALARLSAALPWAALVVSSDLTRAAATADAIAGSRPRLPPDPDLREFNFGTWDGLHHSEVSARDPELSRTFWETPGDIAAPGGESWNAVSARASAAIDRVLADHPGRDVIAVAHFGTILTQVARAGALTPYEALAHRIDPLSLTELHRSPKGWAIARINHLA